MTRLQKIIILILAGGATVAPPFALAHSGDVLLARLILHSSAEVTLEITADPSANPYLKDQSNPAQILGKALRVHLPSGRTWNVGDISTPTVTLKDGFPFSTPIPLSHPAGEREPELYTASWTWRPSESPLRFEVPGETPQTVVFWTTEQGSNVVNPDWRMMVSGDFSPNVPLPAKPSPLRWNWKAGLAILVAALGLGLQAVIILSKIRTKPLR